MKGKIVNMSPRGARNKVFDILTPSHLKEVFKTKGRIIGNGISYTRELESPVLLMTAALGIKGVLPGIFRAAKLILDGYDGYAAEKDLEFKTAKPNLVGLKELRKDIWTTTRPLSVSLDDAAGGTLDHEADQIAQVADQIGCYINGDLNPAYLLLNIGRNKSLKNIRRFYSEISNADLANKEIKSKAAGQFKTLIMDSHQTAESFGWLDKVPKLRAPFAVLGAAAITYSYVDAVSAAETNYLSKTYDTSSLGKLDGFMIGCARYATRNMPNVDITPTNLMLLPPQAPQAEEVIMQLAA